MSNVFFTSDLHIGHQLVANLRLEAMTGVHSGTLENPHLYVVSHDLGLAANWDQTVKPDDQVWILGDLSAGGTKATREALAWLTHRPGHKHLISGNHDPISPIHRNSHKWFPEYLEVFDSVQSQARRKISGRNVLLSHYPYHEDGYRHADRFNQWFMKDMGLPILHGHTHSEEKISYSLLGTPQIHVGLDAWDMQLVPLESVVEVLNGLA